MDTVSCWHTVKLDCGKHHHAETDKGKNRRCFYFQILVVRAEEGKKLLGKQHFHYLQNPCRFVTHVCWSAETLFNFEC